MKIYLITKDKRIQTTQINNLLIVLAKWNWLEWGIYKKYASYAVAVIAFTILQKTRHPVWIS